MLTVTRRAPVISLTLLAVVAPLACSSEDGSGGGSVPGGLAGAAPSSGGGGALGPGGSGGSGVGGTVSAIGGSGGSGGSSVGGTVSAIGGSFSGGANSGGAASGGAASGGDGSTGARPGFNDCNEMNVTCKALPPTCDQGFAPAIDGFCWGDCVDVSTCACSSHDECPDPQMIDEYACNNSTDSCIPWLK